MGTQLSNGKEHSSPPHFSYVPMSIVVKRSPISATAELLFGLLVREFALTNAILRRNGRITHLQPSWFNTHPQTTLSKLFIYSVLRLTQPPTLSRMGNK